jgi:hypothetical protein
MRENLWVVWQVAAAISGGVVFAMVGGRVPRGVGVGVAAAVAILLAVRWWPGDHPRGYGVVAWEVTAIDKEQPDFAALGKFAGRLPGNAALIVQEKSKLENKLIEFAVDRSCYALGQQGWTGVALELSRAGAVPYLVSFDVQPLPAVFVDVANGRTVYACTAEGVAAVGR